MHREPQRWMHFVLRHVQSLAMLNDQDVQHRSTHYRSRGALIAIINSYWERCGKT
jgi:hypothetical protein